MYHFAIKWAGNYSSDKCLRIVGRKAPNARCLRTNDSSSHFASEPKCGFQSRRLEG